MKITPRSGGFPALSANGQIRRMVGKSPDRIVDEEGRREAERFSCVWIPEISEPYSTNARPPAILRVQCNALSRKERPVPSAATIYQFEFARIGRKNPGLVGRAPGFARTTVSAAPLSFAGKIA
jgi:hypothetical protein